MLIIFPDKLILGKLWFSLFFCLSNLLPVDRQDLIRVSRRQFEPILSVIKRGWNTSSKIWFSKYYSKWGKLAITHEVVLHLDDAVLISPSSRQLIMSNLYSGHVEIDKIKSLARFTCWCPGADNDIKWVTKCRKIRYLNQIFNLRNGHHSLCRARFGEIIHTDYGGPLMNNYWALVIVEWYSHWSKMYFTTSADAEFSVTALRENFILEGASQALVIDNGSQFTGEKVTSWFKRMGCRRLLIEPRYQQPSMLAEKVILTLKYVIKSLNPSTIQEPEQSVDNFSLQ